MEFFLPKSCSKSRKDDFFFKNTFFLPTFYSVFLSSWLKVEDVVDIFVATLINLAFFEFFAILPASVFAGKIRPNLKKLLFWGEPKLKPKTCQTSFLISSWFSFTFEPETEGFFSFLVCPRSRQTSRTSCTTICSSNGGTRTQPIFTSACRLLVLPACLPSALPLLLLLLILSAVSRCFSSSYSPFSLSRLSPKKIRLDFFTWSVRSAKKKFGESYRSSSELELELAEDTCKIQTQALSLSLSPSFVVPTALYSILSLWAFYGLQALSWAASTSL